MKVLFIVRANLYAVKGGDTIQVTNTAKFLKKSGAQVDIHFSTAKIDYSSYDLIHFFNIIRPADILHHIQLSQKPYVVSTIFVDYSEYDKKHRGGLAGLLFKIASPDTVEYLKAIARFIVNGEKIASREYLWRGHKLSVKKTLKNAALLLPNSNNEYNRLVKHYGIQQAYTCIPNGIDPGIFKPETTLKKDDTLVLHVGRIEGIKNQLNLIKALRNTKYRLLIIGSPAPNQVNYYRQCKKLATENITFIESMPQEMLLNYYSTAKVHVLPSWFETTGLSSLEAAAMGCNIVISDKGDVREYFSDFAWYCDPGSPASIFDAVEKAANSALNSSLQTKVFSEYIWEQTAKKTYAAYRQVLNLQ